MYLHGDLRALIELAGRYPMTNGWQVMVRAEWVDVSPSVPQGLSYALILQDENGDRLLGFDNSHAPDGAKDEGLFDHEHRANAPWRTYAYTFTSAGQLITDFFDRVRAYCKQRDIEFSFEDPP
jgi:hypothetical protein